MKWREIGFVGILFTDGLISFTRHNLQNILEAKNVDKVEMFPGFWRQTLVSGDNLMLCLFTWQKGASLPAHSHFHEQAGYVIHDMMHEKTSTFVLASGKEKTAFNMEEEFTISSHPSPALLIDKVLYKCKHISTHSNVISAKMVIEGLSDLCITTTKAINAIEEFSQVSRFNILKYFGPVDMVWIIFSKI